MPNYITQSAYARRRGVAKSAVARAVSENRITLINGMIDPEVADIQWAKNTRARGDSGGKGKPAGTAAANAPAVVPDVATGDDYSSSRARRERAEAAMAELELAKISGKVLDREGGLRAVYTKFRELRDSCMVLGRKLSPKLAAMSDEREIRIAVDRAVAEVFETFARRSLQSLADGLNGAPAAVPPDLRQAPPSSQDTAA